MLEVFHEKIKKKKKHSADIFIGKFLHVKKDIVELSNGKLTNREWIKHPGTVCCIPILSHSKIGLTKQYKYEIEMIECGLITDAKIIIGLLWCEKYLLKNNKPII
jgi:hypothetical protein